MQAHTILLVQPGPKPESRTYSDYESVNECMEGVCKIYEEHLKRLNPNTPSITYDISQLFDFIDQLTDLSCLVWVKCLQTFLFQISFQIIFGIGIALLLFWNDLVGILHCFEFSKILFCLFRYQKISNTYAPYNKDWIKEKIYVLLRRQAAKAPWMAWKKLKSSIALRHFVLFFVIFFGS